MIEDDLHKNVRKAAKWSTITEISAKIILPVSNMILARLLSPEAFGIVATVTMIFSFADMLTDAGFQKYLIQHEFKNEKEKYNYANVAFWTNLQVSLITWIVIIIFRNQIATLVGSPKLGNVIWISCFQLLITSISSIQMALFTREFNFKALFFIRMISVFLPFVVTIPLAILGFKYWSLIIGTLCGQLSNSIILTINSKWKPRLFYDVKILKKMLSFSIWSLLEAISIWLSAWVDVFLIGSALSVTYLGLYRTSLNTVNLLFSIITASITPVLFSALSRLQSDSEAFKGMFYRNQKFIAYLIIPMGVGIFLYSNTITYIMLGSQWMTANYIIGIWGITTAVKIVFSDLSSECYRAKGLPKLSLIIQLSQIIVLVPTCLISLSYGFKALVYARALIRGELILASLLAMKYLLGFSIKRIVLQVTKPIFFSIIMAFIAIVLKTISSDVVWDILSIVICCVVYFILILIFARKDFKGFMNIKKVVPK